MAGHSAGDGIGEDHNEPLSPVSPASATADTRDVFSDDYAESFTESYAPSILAPSIRQARSASPSPERPSVQHDPYRTSWEGLNSPFADPPARSRSSIRKSAENVQSGVREEFRRGSGLPLVATPGVTAQPRLAAVAHRSISSASSFAGSQSPTSHGGEGPSHPYTMYPQGLAMSRTASVASTARPLSMAQSVRGPSHPYAMYSQNVGEDGPSASHQNGIPVGFPGSSNNYHRRIGPEGEEQDIIGPDGHTEQLPPYSRYPDEVNNKDIVQASALPSIGEQHGEDHSPVSSAVATSLSPSDAPHHDLEEPDSGEHESNEKTWKGKTTKEKWQTKAFGVPFWLLLLCFVLIVVTAVVLGAVLGAVIANKHQDYKMARRPPYASTPWPDQALSTSLTTSSITTTTAYLDVTSPTSTPTWIYPPSSANYTIDAGSPVGNFSGCLPGAQRAAWSCLLHDDTTVLNIHESNNATVISLFALNPTLQYGTQPPVISSDQIELVQDPETDTRAFAWHFQTTYDKLVVLDLNDGLLPLNNKRRRDAQPPWYATGLQQKQSDDSDSDSDVDPDDPDNVTDDQAWFCYWNQTFIEVLVYAGNSSGGSMQATATPSSSTFKSPPSIPPPMPTVVSSSPSSNHAPSASNLETQVVSSSTVPSSTTAYSANAESWWDKLIPGHSKDAPAAPPSRVIKIEERRVPSIDAPPPTCTLMQFSSDGQWRPVIRSSGVIPVVALKEMDPSETPMSSSPSSPLLGRDAIPTDACGCEWMSPDGQFPA